MLLKKWTDTNAFSSLVFHKWYGKSYVLKFKDRFAPTEAVLKQSSSITAHSALPGQCFCCVTRLHTENSDFWVTAFHIYF